MYIERRVNKTVLVGEIPLYVCVTTRTEAVSTVSD